MHTQTPKAGLIGMLAAFLARVPIRMHDVVGLPLMEKRGLKYYLLYFVEKVVYACSQDISELFWAKKIYDRHKACVQYKNESFSKWLIQWS